MKLKKTILLILILFVSLIPEVRALTPQSQTVKITDTHDDRWITETGVGIDSSLVTIKDPGMDLRAYLVFRELDINYWEPLKNATLRLHTASSLISDPDNSITIYGMDLPDLQLEGFLLPSTVLSLGFTEAYTNYNTSEFSGNQWHEINVTDIVEELIRNPNWDGDGIAGTETGDAIGFHILGSEGDDKRYFYDLLAGNGFEAQLILHWNHEPPPPAGYTNPVFNSTYRGYHIWYIPDSLWMNYTEWAEVDASSKIDVYNSSYVNLGTQFNMVYVGSLSNTSRAPFTTGRWKFGVMVSKVSDGLTGKRTNILLHCLGEPGYQPSFNSYSGAGEHALGFGISDYDDQTDNKFYFSIETYAGSRYEYYSPSSYDVNSTKWYWVEIFYDAPNQYYRAEIYNDYEMTDLEANLTRGPLYTHMDTSYDCEFAVLAQGFSASVYHEGAVRSEPGDPTWVVTDENGTIIEEDLEDFDDAILEIDILLGADPEDPDPPSEEWETGGPFTRFKTRLYILLLGIALIFGPPIYFAYSRPSGYEFVIGLFIMLVGLAFMIASGSI